MSCTNPMHAYQLLEYETETSPVIFKKPSIYKMHEYEQLRLPCGKCIACLRTRALTRAVQLYCELKTTEYGTSWFITLTYDDEHLPDSYSLNKTDIILFIKRLRKYRNKNNHQGKFRYEQVGEYGSQTHRPHHHMCAFNLDPGQLTVYSIPEGRYNLYTSEVLTEIWGKGQILITELTMESCLYVAQHVDKKINTTPNHEQSVVNPATGEYITDRLPEYATRSSNPGIGKKWWDLYGHTDLYGNDRFRTTSGSESKVPPYFDKQLKKDNPKLYEAIKKQRKENAEVKTYKQLKYQQSYNEAITKWRRSNLGCRAKI